MTPMTVRVSGLQANTLVSAGPASSRRLAFPPSVPSCQCSSRRTGRGDSLGGWPAQPTRLLPELSLSHSSGRLPLSRASARMNHRCDRVAGGEMWDETVTFISDRSTQAGIAVSARVKTRGCRAEKRPMSPNRVFAGSEQSVAQSRKPQAVVLVWKLLSTKGAATDHR